MTKEIVVAPAAALAAVDPKSIKEQFVQLSQQSSAKCAELYDAIQDPSKDIQRILEIHTATTLLEIEFLKQGIFKFMAADQVPHETRNGIENSEHTANDLFAIAQSFDLISTREATALGKPGRISASVQKIESRSEHFRGEKVAAPEGGGPFGMSDDDLNPLPPDDVVEAEYRETTEEF